MSDYEGVPLPQIRVRRLVPVAVALSLAAGCTGGSGSAGAPARVSGTQGPYAGLELSPATPKPQITLTDTAGSRYDLRTATTGKVTYLYFGYTHCPDECPTTMADLASALRKLPTPVRAKVAVVFVTTDPRRDTGPVLRHWLDGFSPSFVGLTGAPDRLAAAQRDSGVPLAEPEPAGAGGDYSVQHSAELLAFSPDGQAHVAYVGGATADDYAHDLPTLLRKSG